MINKITVSICCITYNHENYIADAIESFLMQKTNFPIEILIHDDASTDNTAKIIRNYEKKHPEIIKPIYQKENQYSKGVRSINKFNFSRAQGKYIALCEGDDYWTDPLKLQKQVDFLEANPEYSLVHTDIDKLYDKTNKIIKSYYKRNGVIHKDNPTVCDIIEGKYVITTCSVMFKKEVSNSFLSDSNYLTFNSGDYSLFCEAANYGKIGFINESTTVRRVQGNSVSQSNDYHKRKKFIDGSKVTGLYISRKFNCDDSKIILKTEKYRARLFFEFNKPKQLKVPLQKIKKLNKNLTKSEKFFWLASKSGIFFILLKSIYLLMQKYYLYKLKNK